MPLHRVYYLRPPGGRLIADLLIITRPARDDRDGTSAAGRGRAGPVTGR